MTGPITFDPIPVPSRQSIVDIPPSAAAQATALDANFAKVNTYLQAQPLVSAPAFSRNLTNLSINQGGRAYVPFSASVWPGFSTVLPDADAYLLYIGAEVAVTSWNYVGLVPYLSGPGVVSAGYKQGVWLSNRSFISGGAATILPRSAFNPGQRVDLAPYWYVDQPGSFYFDLGEVGIVGLA